jgi:hypothetical protein
MLSLVALLKRAWARWKVVAHVIGNFQARVLLTLFYFVVVPPFALIVKLFKDPLALRGGAAESYWVSRPAPDPPEIHGTRQF